MNDRKKLAELVVSAIEAAYNNTEQSVPREFCHEATDAAYGAVLDALAAEPPQAVGPVAVMLQARKIGINGAIWHEHYADQLPWLRENGYEVRALGVIEPVQQKSLSASVADALRPFLAEGQKVIWCEPFRWHDDNGVMSNHFEGMSVYALAQEFGYQLIHDCGCAAVIATNPKDTQA